MVRLFLFQLLPTVPIVASAVASRDEYFFAPRVGLAASFVLASLTVAWLRRSRAARSDHAGSGRALMVGIAVAWGCALAVLAALNLTPLCVGRDNGDGLNTLGMCIAYSGVAAVVDTAVVMSVAVATAGAAAWVWRSPRRPRGA